MKTKKFFDWIHRWFGLIAGLYFVLLGLSGSYLVYEDEIEELLKPSLRISKSARPEVELETLLALARQGLNLPLEKAPMMIRVPRGETRNALITFDLAGEGEPRRTSTAFVDPSAKAFVGQEVYRETFAGKTFAFHHDLFWGRTGRTIMAVSGGFMLALLLTGLYLWWPKRGRWRQALSLGRTSNTYLWNFEFHRLAGFYSLALMVLVTWTGVFISRPDWFGVKPGARGGRSPGQGAKAERLISNVIDASAIEAAIKAEGLSLRPLVIRVNAASGEVLVTAAERTLRLDTNGAKLEKAPAENRNGPTPGARARQIHHDLHVGRFWGEAGRFLIFVSGFLPLFFYVTGYVMWRRKSALKRTSK